MYGLATSVKCVLSGASEQVTPGPNGYPLPAINSICLVIWPPVTPDEIIRND